MFNKVLVIRGDGKPTEVNTPLKAWRKEYGRPTWFWFREWGEATTELCVQTDADLILSITGKKWDLTSRAVAKYLGGVDVDELRRMATELHSPTYPTGYWSPPLVAKMAVAAKETETEEEYLVRLREYHRQGAFKLEVPFDDPHFTRCCLASRLDLKERASSPECRLLVDEWAHRDPERVAGGHLLWKRPARRYRHRPAGSLRSYVVRINGRKHYVHRALYQLATSRRLRPDELVVKTCDHPECLEPSHHQVMERRPYAKWLLRNTRRNGRMKLSDQQVRRLRYERQQYGCGIADLARSYGISWRYCYDLVNGRVRRNVEGSAR